MIDIGNVESNTLTLKKTVKYLDGSVKEIVEKHAKREK